MDKGEALNTEDWQVLIDEQVNRQNLRDRGNRKAETSLPGYGINQLESKSQSESKKDFEREMGQKIYMPLNVSFSNDDEDTQPDIPNEFINQELDAEAESRSGAMIIRILGVPKVGKTSLGKSISDMLVARGWRLTEFDSESEFISLQRTPYGTSITISSRNDEKKDIKMKDLNVCIFALPPHYTEEYALAELKSILRENKYDLVLPVVCKADCMTEKERLEYVNELIPRIKDTASVGEKCLFCVVASSREYSWGHVHPTSDISELRELCDTLESHLQLDVVDDSDNDQIGQNLSKVDCESEKALGNSEAVCAFWFTLSLLFVLAIIVDPIAFQEHILFCLSDLEISYIIPFVLPFPFIKQRSLSLLLAIVLAIFVKLSDDAKQKETLNMSLTLQQLTSENLNSRMLLKSCDVQLEICTNKYENISRRLYDTSDRLAMALERCGSWCLEI